MRLDSIAYRLLWNARRLLRMADCGPHPIIWRDPKEYAPSEKWRADLDPAAQQRLDTILDEMRLISRVYSYTPAAVTDAQFAHLLDLSTRKARFDFIHFLRQKEHRREADDRRDAAYRRTADDEPSTENGGEEKTVIEQLEPSSSSWGSGMRPSLITASPNYMKRCERQADRMRFVRAVRLAGMPRIIVDCRFLPLHSYRGLNLTLLQLALAVSQNRQRAEPWPLHLANFNLATVAERLHNGSNLTPFIEGNESYVEISNRSYLDLFPEAAATGKLMYLSPHADEALPRVDADASYIIGGIVDRMAEPLIEKYASRVTADAEQLPSYRLPLDEHLNWKSGNKLLTITGVIKILQDVYDGGGADWQRALERTIPVRKLRDATEKNPRVRAKRKNLLTHRRAVLQILDENLPPENNV